MKEIEAMIAAETPDLERLVLDALAPAHGIVPLAWNDRNVPPAAIFIGASPGFFLRQQERILRLEREGCGVVCVGGEADPDRAGAPGFLPLPQRRDAPALERFRKSLLIRIKSAYGRGEWTAPNGRRRESSRKLVGIGASTGGPQTLLSILRALPKRTCGILVVQHLTAGFSARFTEYLAPLCVMEVKQAEDGDLVEDGVIYLAEDRRHLTVVRRGDAYRLRSLPGEKVNGFCPSADCLFESMASQAGAQAMGVVLTGMGDDGARGLRLLRENGGQAVAQDAESCVVSSMPREAVRLGAAEQLALEKIAARILQFSGENGKQRPGP